MEYRRLGKSGLRVSELSYGSWVTFSFQLDKQKAKKAMKHAYDSGINFFDNAEVYAAGESEKIMGDALKELGSGDSTKFVLPLELTKMLGNLGAFTSTDD